MCFTARMVCQCSHRSETYFEGSEGGTHQAKLYADRLEKMTGRRPIIFTTNGFETNIWDSVTSPPREVSGIFSN